MKNKDQKKETADCLKTFPIRISAQAYAKTKRIHQLTKYSAAKYLWGKDSNLLKYNVLLTPMIKHYQVLLALGRKPR